MYARILVSLSVFATTLHITFCLDGIFVDNVVSYCQNKVMNFTATEKKYVRAQRKLAEPSLFGPPFEDLLRIVYWIDQKQRVFECISDTLHTNSEVTLEESDGYRALVQTCVSERPPIPNCDPFYPYKSINGTCNNIFNPTWGSAHSCLRRLFPASYVGISGIKKYSAKGKRKLPEPRYISLMIVEPRSAPTRDYTSLFVFFGQTIAHDLIHSIFTPVEGDHLMDCCKYARTKDQHPECLPILHQPYDPFYTKHNVSCLSFQRWASCHTCSVATRIPLSQAPSYIDCSAVYGQTEEIAILLRRNDGTGKLKSQYTESEELLPPEVDLGSSCGEAEKQQFCFKGGDTRTNNHALLMILQTLLLREHNRIADDLKTINSHWNEDKLYQVARKILIAEYQVVIYKEYLPLLLGQDLMSKYGLSFGNKSVYDPRINPSISVEFSSAAFRLHTLIPSEVISHEHLKNLFINTVPLYTNKLSSYLSKMADFPGKKYGWFMPYDVTNFLYMDKFGTYGFDLAAVDIQRGRDVGLPTYSQVIEYMENRPGTITKFKDLKKYIIPECQLKLQKTYDDVRDIDLWVGFMCEQIPEDMIISKTAALIIAEQFRGLKFGDRFFIEHDVSLSDEQRQTLHKTSLAKLICDNTDVDFIQPLVMQFPSVKNYPQLCSDIPGVDLEKWKEWK